MKVPGININAAGKNNILWEALHNGIFVLPNTRGHTGISYSGPHVFNTHVLPMILVDSPGRVRSHVIRTS